jgi:hypothetical protein
VAESAGAPGMSSSCWRGVDTGDPGFFVGYLDRAAAGLREARREAAAVLEVQPGCSVLDVGSGPGASGPPLGSVQVTAARRAESALPPDCVRSGAWFSIVWPSVSGQHAPWGWASRQ